MTLIYAKWLLSGFGALAIWGTTMGEKPFMRAIQMVLVVAWVWVLFSAMQCVHASVG